MNKSNGMGKREGTIIGKTQTLDLETCMEVSCIEWGR